MKKVILLTVICFSVLTGTAMAQRIQPLNVFPWTLSTENLPLYPENVEQLCTTDIIDSRCEVNVDGGTLVTKDVPFSGTVKDVPFSGVATYSGTLSLPYSGEAPYSGTLSLSYSGEAPYSGMLSLPYSGEAFVNGELPITASGTVSFDAYSKSGVLDFIYAVGAVACGPGIDKGCCTAKGNPDDGTVTLICQKIDPSLIIENLSSQYEICEATTFNVPWTHDGMAPYIGSIPYSGTVEGTYSGTAPCSGTVEGTYSGTAPYSGTVQDSYSGSVPYSGVVDAPFSGTVQAEYREYAAADVLYNEGSVALDCPAAADVPTQEVTFRELVTNAYVGDHIEIEATGWTAAEKTVASRIIVRYAEPGSAMFTLVTRTDKIQTVANGIFKTSLDGGLTFDKAGTYQVVFRVWRPNGTLAGGTKTRMITVVEPPLAQ